MIQQPEYECVERPFIDQLISMGWQWTTGNPDSPSVTGRESFRDVLLQRDLADALRRINLDPTGQAWLDEGRITQAVSALTRPQGTKLLEINQHATELLLKGTVVDGVEGWDQGRGRTVHFIDWEHPERNTFRVVNQLRIDLPGGQAKKHIVPDLVLFCNGVPLVVVECKAPGSARPMEAAIEQLQRYANQREWIEDDEGCERLFHTNQFVIATAFDEARVGTFSSRAVHFLEWKDTSPTPMADVAKALKKNKLSSQEMLVAGMLRPAHLLDLIRHFTLFMSDGARTYKVVCRYQQYRAVQRAIERLLHGKTRRQDGELDRRGGIIWHTQGSGKSLTMVFLVRRMRSEAALRGFKIVVVTDRKDLQKQLAATAALTDESLTVIKPETTKTAKRSASDVLQDTLRRPGKDLVFAMIQKYRGSEDDEPALDALADSKSEETPYPELNASESILVLVDEAHRSHGSEQHARLLASLPHCARIAFTGTPILMGARKRTHAIFGDFIDRYTIKQSEADGATLPIKYEGRTAVGALKNGGTLDALFEDMFAASSDPATMEAIKQRYATKGNVLEAEALIREKAADMLRHYVAYVLPNGFKAQVVAVSRSAAVRYQKALCDARDAMVASLEALDPTLLACKGDALDALPAADAERVRAHAHLGLLRRIEFAAVISGGANDDPAWKPWTDPVQTDARIARFKKPLVHNDPEKCDPLAFLIVKSMLLTGFDAPVEQVMYLDRSIREAELLQAIARVNRTHGEAKRAGLVVDYYGVAQHLTDALKEYSRDDVVGALESLRDELPGLRAQHRKVLDLFEKRGVPIVAPLSPRERGRLAVRFARWRHPRVNPPAAEACLGDGTPAGALPTLEALDRLLSVPTPGSPPDPYALLHAKLTRALRTLTAGTLDDALEQMEVTERLLLQVEPLLYKLLALIDPAAFAKASGSKRGLATGLMVLIELGKSPYTLKLSPKEFESLEGWALRTSYENAVRDVVPARLDVAHRAVELDVRLWESAAVMLLGLVDKNRDALTALPRPDAPSRRDQEGAVELLGDEGLRAEFQSELKDFLSRLDLVLPRPEALAFVSDARQLGMVQARARNRYRSDEPLIGAEVGAKVRALIDEHIVSLGIDVKVPPISLTDARFAEHVAEQGSSKEQASEMEHALRYHIRKHFDEDPELYEKLSERLKKILAEHEGHWDDVARALTVLHQDALRGRGRDDTGLDPQTHLPFFALLKREAVGDEALNAAGTKRFVNLTNDIVTQVRAEIARVDFWQNTVAQKSLRDWFVKCLDNADAVPFERVDALADRLMELARANHSKLRG